jgi:carbamoyl-phosphate synthase small subunit
VSAPTRRDWARERAKGGFLALADGSVFRGHSAGASCDALGEVVFNTGMSGYQEILTDPSYAGQFVTMTYPEIGNVGTNDEDMESRRLFANGFLIRELNRPSNWRACASLGETLVAAGIPALAGVDTRGLTTLLRDKGTQKGYLSVEGRVGEEEAVREAQAWPGLDNQDYAAKVSCTEPYRWDPDGARTMSWGIARELPEPDLRIVAYDFGIKWNILRCMRASGMDVTVVPARTTAAETLALRPDGVFFSNGPADPAAVTYAVEAARGLVGKVPLMGICLGHQLFGIALGGRTFRLKFGHHGCNHPVRDLRTGAVEITSQNHNYAVDPDSVNQGRLEVTHVNLNDGTVEGLAHRSEPVFSVQYHPEAAPGPHDPRHLFGRFREMIGKR